jgi:hypothetical protein
MVKCFQRYRLDCITVQILYSAVQILHECPRIASSPRSGLCTKQPDVIPYLLERTLIWMLEMTPRRLTKHVGVVSRQAYKKRRIFSPWNLSTKSSRKT